MTTNERIKEIVDKSLLEFYKSTITEEACGSMILKIRRGNLGIIVKNAILECAKNLSATIEAQRKEIEELKKDKERLDFILTGKLILANGVSEGGMIDWVDTRDDIDSAISKQKENEV